MSLTMPAIRIKLTGVCNRTCSFCHEEGGMKSIQNVLPTEEFFICIEQIVKKTNIQRIMLTGGEPTAHPDLPAIISGLSKISNEISITTNGIQVISSEEWKRFKKNGLTKVIVSIHDTKAGDLLNLESVKKSIHWAEKALSSQYQNIENIIAADLYSRINIVAYGGFEKAFDSIKKLLSIQKDGKPEIRLLNDLTHLEASQEVIKAVLNNLGAKEMSQYRRAGSSNVTDQYLTPDSKILSTKLAYPYFLNSICNNCTVKDKCYEGFYGIRVERISNEYYVRLCIYKQTPDVLIPWQDFVKNQVSDEIGRCNVVM